MGSMGVMGSMELCVFLKGVGLFSGWEGAALESSGPPHDPLLKKLCANRKVMS